MFICQTLINENLQIEHFLKQFKINYQNIKHIKIVYKHTNIYIKLFIFK